MFYFYLLREILYPHPEVMWTAGVPRPRMATTMSPSTLTCSFTLCAACSASVQLNDIVGFVIEGLFICGYLQFRTGCLHSVLEWSRSVSNLWLTDLYGPIHYETNALIVNGDTWRDTRLSLLLTREFFSFSPLCDPLMPFSRNLTRPT